MAEEELRIDTSSTGSTADAKQRRVRVDSNNMKSAYCNVFGARDNPNEVVLNFGFSQNPTGRQRHVEVQILQQVILHPATARQLKDTLVALFQKRDARHTRTVAQSDSPKKPN